MSTPTETLAAARQALDTMWPDPEIGHGHERDDITAALDLLARLTAPPDEERERGIAERLAAWDSPPNPCKVEIKAVGRGGSIRHVSAMFAHAPEDLRYLLAQLAAARAERDTLRREVEGMRAALAETVRIADELQAAGLGSPHVGLVAAPAAEALLPGNGAAVGGSDGE